MSAGARSVHALRRCVVVGGAGAVGTMFSGLLREAGAEVCVVDKAIPAPAQGVSGGDRGPRWIVDDIQTPGKPAVDAVRQADLVMLALPETVALRVLAGVLDAMRSDALLVETLSVKSHACASVARHPSRVEAVGLNPMFAPALGMPGRPVAAVVTRDGPKCAELLDLLRSWGGRVVRVDGARHDRLVATTQALTHAAVLGFGLALSDLGVTLDEIAAVAPPPHVMMLALLARIVGGVPDVYWDIQSGNPEAPRARQALADGVQRVLDLARRGDEQGFADALAALRAYMGPAHKRYGALCAETFARHGFRPSSAAADSTDGREIEGA